MLRFKILASAIPVIVAALFARGGLVPGTHPCIRVGEVAVQMTSVPWQAKLRVSFTDDPALATVRVQIADSAEAADFAVVDDGDNASTDSCAANAATRLVAISTVAAGNGPVIYLTAVGPADYRIFVQSKTFSARDAAALIVGASDGHRPQQAASL